MILLESRTSAPPLSAANGMHAFPITSDVLLGTLLRKNFGFSMSSSTRVDVVVYGATGYTGRLVTKYLAKLSAAAPSSGRPSFTWAVAGRSKNKLEQLIAGIGASPKSVGVIVADAADPKSLETLASSAKIVLACVGPFDLYGEPVVAACVRNSTHYLDITGEFPFVKRIIDKHHDEASARGVAIVPMSGFDSVPSDLGNWLVNDYAQRNLSEQVRAVTGYYRVSGGPSRGTLESIVNAVTNVNPRDMHPLLLLPKDAPKPARIPTWRNFVMFYDTALGKFTAPWIMGGSNEKLVRRSNGLNGRSTSYQEIYGGSFIECLLSTLTFYGLFLSLAIAPVRKLVTKLMPPPGEGPSESSFASGKFHCTFIGHTMSGKKVVAKVMANPGHPYAATAWFASEVALALLERDRAGTIKGGVLTPTTAVDPNVLITRLKDQGVRSEVSH